MKVGHVVTVLSSQQTMHRIDSVCVGVASHALAPRTPEARAGRSLSWRLPWSR